MLPATRRTSGPAPPRPAPPTRRPGLTRPAATAPRSPSPRADGGDGLPAFHARLAAALAAARAVADWRATRPALPAYSPTAAVPAAEVAGDVRLLEAWHEGAWAALAVAHASGLGSGDWDAVLSGGGGGP